MIDLNSTCYKYGNIGAMEWLWSCWIEAWVISVQDMKCIHIGLECIQEAAANRPTMSEIVMMLSTYSTITSLVPSRLAFLVTRENPESELVTKDAGASSQQFEPKPEPSKQSIHEVTITDLDPP